MIVLLLLHGTAQEPYLGRRGPAACRFARQTLGFVQMPGLKMKLREEIERIGVAGIRAQAFGVEARRFVEVARLVRTPGALQQALIHLAL